MPRRNNRNKGRRPQARRGGWGGVPYVPAESDFRGTALVNGLPQRQAKPKLLPMVKSDGVCATGKIRYGTPADAEEALRRALINREILQSPVVEERWYPQPGDAPCHCQGYHLTSAPRRTR